MFDQTDLSQAPLSANSSEGASLEPPGSERSRSETYRAVGAALLAWVVAVGAWGLFQLPGEAGTIELPNGSRTPGSSHAFTTHLEAGALGSSEVQLDATTDLVSALAGLDPAALPELADVLADLHLAPSTVKLLLLKLFQVARPDLHVSPSADVPLGGGGFQQLQQPPDPDQAFNLVDLIVLRGKLQALLLLFLLNPNFGNIDLLALQPKLQALLQLPNTALEQLDLRALNASLNAVFQGNFERSGAKAELDKIDLPVVKTNVALADVVKPQSAQIIAPRPVNPPVDPTLVSAAQTQAPAPTVTAQIPQIHRNVRLMAPTSEPRPSSAEPVPPQPPRPLPPTPTNSQNELDPTTAGNKFEPGTMKSPTVDSKPPTSGAPSTTSGKSGSDGGSVSRPTAGADRGGHLGESRGGGPTRP